MTFKAKDFDVAIEAKETAKAQMKEFNKILAERKLYSDKELNRNNGVYLQQQEIEALKGYSDPVYRGAEEEYD